MRVLGLSGSLRRDSHNRALLRAAAAALPPGAELVEWDRIAELPAYDEDLDRVLQAAGGAGRGNCEGAGRGRRGGSRAPARAPMTAAMPAM